MRIALLLRGFHAYAQRPRNRNPLSPSSFDFRETWSNIDGCIVAPLRLRGDVSVYIATYRSDAPTQAALEGMLQPKRVVYRDDVGYQQLHLIRDGLQLLLDEEADFDEVWIVRFDLIYKAPMDAWPLHRLQAGGATVPFCCEKTMCDTLFVVRGGWYVLAKFWAAICTGISLGAAADLHPGASYFKACRLPWAAFHAGAYDSATHSAALESKNPMYMMHGRAYHFDDAPRERATDDLR
jgi:hypothetical protein